MSVSHVDDHRQEGDHAMTIKQDDRSRGQAMVEFVLVFVIFAWGLFGLVDFSRWVYSTNSVNEIAREAARQGTVALRPADCNGLSRIECIQTLARNRLNGVAINLSDVQVVCQRLDNEGLLPASEDTDNCGATWRANDLVRVEINSNLMVVTPLVGQFLGSAPIHGEAQVTVNG